MNLWRELLRVDLSEQLSSIHVPYFILQGDTDIVTSTKKIKQFVENSGNDYLQFKLVSDSGHIPGAGAMDQVLQTMRELIRAC